ncbi:hypothetical protein ATOP_17860 [Granulimonas faecalis]|uniref:PPM-type phosphatase domain-containing protein n=1 Tax=Granulimonas faecalis TaxID=2894155 RepID=A0AAV5B764_9ACTN|nr:Stp1/IreP family PP2C-type Ser/Thr phosphatase [Granulimonas faecalis]GJM56131.1 hypothetical protein ATOP_17860 [Granulimonas faecalis]
MTDEQHLPVPASVTQATAPSRPMLDLERRPGSDSESGSDRRLAWGSRSDVGLIRDHNEDSYLCRPPLFAVSDGMGGHAAGEVASSIAIHTIAKEAPATADSAQLGAAIEAANMDVLTAPETGRGREGMGCTATACIIEDDRMAVAHVGDSRLYLLHKGALVRVTHDHSFVEELVDAGEITADEARVHPSRSVITRALGSDPDMYADHFTIGVEAGERVILCSDGLSSMVTDAEIEDICVTSASPQVCADALVSAALIAGGHDNVTVIVVDIRNDGKEDIRRRGRRRAVLAWVGVLAAFLAVAAVVLSLFINSTFYLAPSGDTVGIYQGMEGDFLGVPLSHLVEETDVPVASLPEAVQSRLSEGISVESEDKARTTVEDYRRQIQEAAGQAKETADTLKSSGDQGGAAS